MDNYEIKFPINPLSVYVEYIRHGEKKFAFAT